MLGFEMYHSRYFRFRYVVLLLILATLAVEGLSQSRNHSIDVFGLNKTEKSFALRASKPLYRLHQQTPFMIRTS